MLNLDKQYNYDELYSNKWSYREEKTGEKDILPLWVADMDFETVPEIRQAIEKRASVGIYGYSSTTKEYDAAVCSWFLRRHGWALEPQQIVQTPGVVSALTIGVQTFSQEGDGILILTPVYHPFYRLIKNTKRKVIASPLRETEAGFAVDFADFEEKIKVHRPKVCILCNPHNPVGKVFSREELQTLAELCLRYQVLILSDEIHCDIIYPDHKHIPLATLSDEIAQNAIICTALSKTFNIAGLQNSNIIIPNPELRRRFKETMAYFGYPHISLFPVPVTIAAYTHGDAWLEEVLSYIQANRDYSLQYIKEHLPGLRAHKPQGTYFLWVDFRSLGFTNEELEDFLLHKAKVWFNQGYIFGEEGAGFVRINLACSKALLTQAWVQIKTALADFTKKESE